MKQKPKYAIDTCSFASLRRLYPMDVFPGAWEFMNELADRGVIISSEEIIEELRFNDDDVLEWAVNHENIFKPLDKQVQLQAARILAEYPRVIDLKKRKSSADPFLVATAIISSTSVVTEEKPTNMDNGKLKIPDICRLYEVPCMPLLEMLRNEGLKLDRIK